MRSNTVVSETSVQHRAEYIALRSACVHYDGAGGVFLRYTVQKAGLGYTACRG